MDWLTVRTYRPSSAFWLLCAATVKPERSEAFNALAGAVGLDMAQWWQPTAANYLGACPKPSSLKRSRRASAERRRQSRQPEKGRHGDDRRGTACGQGLASAVLRR